MTGARCCCDHIIESNYVSIKTVLVKAEKHMKPEIIVPRGFGGDMRNTGAIIFVFTTSSGFTFFHPHHAPETPPPAPSSAEHPHSKEASPQNTP